MTTATLNKPLAQRRYGRVSMYAAPAAERMIETLRRDNERKDYTIERQADQIARLRQQLAEATRRARKREGQ